MRDFFSVLATPLNTIICLQDFELRNYAPSVWVGTDESNADLRSFKTTRMFQKLFQYISKGNSEGNQFIVLFGFSLTVKAATLIFISGCGSAISSAKEGQSGLFIIW